MEPFGLTGEPAGATSAPPHRDSRSVPASAVEAPGRSSGSERWQPSRAGGDTMRRFGLPRGRFGYGPAHRVGYGGSTLAKYGTVSHISGGPPESVYRTIVRMPAYERGIRGLLSDGEQRDLEYRLALDPRVGRVVRGTGGVRKVRVAPAGRGKRGGIRVIYYYRAAKELVYLILAYANAERDTLSGAEKLRIRTLTSQLESEP